MPRINQTMVLPNTSQQILLMESLDLHQAFSNLDKVEEILLDFRPIELNEKTPPQPKFPVDFIQKITDLTKDNQQKFGIILAGSSDYRVFADSLSQVLPLLDVIVIDFAGFRDGRGYSLAQEIRQHADFNDNTVLRVMGDILPDTLQLLAEVGFSEFDIDNPDFNDSWFDWFKIIKTPYNGRSVKQLPMFASV